MALKTAADGYRFAEGTPVPYEKSLQEIQRELERYGATGFLNYMDPRQVFYAIGFQLPETGAFILTVALPDPQKYPKDGPPLASKSQSAAEARKTHGNAWNQEFARIMRTLLDLVQAKFRAVSAGVTSFEKEFFTDLVIWNEQGQQTTVYEWYAPQVQYLKDNGLQPPLLPAVAEPRRFGNRAAFGILESKG